MNLLQLAGLVNRPTEFFDRASASLERRLEPYVRARPSYATQEWPDALLGIGGLLQADLNQVMAEDSLTDIESEVRSRQKIMPSDAPFPTILNGDFRMARLTYAVVRVIKPTSVVETGVCYGVTSAFILKALARNGMGTLYSIDLPPLAEKASEYVGWLVPQELRSRWQLRLGTSREWLPRVLGELEAVDLFLHDSLHTYRNIRKELQTVTPSLRQKSVVIADDIEGNSAFLEWTIDCKPDYAAAIAEEAKHSLLGVGVFAGNE